MSLYWFFDFPTVAALNAMLPAVRDSLSFQDALRATVTARAMMSIRRSSPIPLWAAPRGQVCR
jgi:hypothetical protein